jgi:hypothetical protein
MNRVSTTTSSSSSSSSCGGGGGGGGVSLQLDFFNCMIKIHSENPTFRRPDP